MSTRQLVRWVAPVLVIVLTVSGCATVVGTAAGPVTGLYSCAKWAADEAPAAFLFTPLFPVIGVIGGFFKGLIWDANNIYGGEEEKDRINPFDPCGSQKKESSY